MGDSEVVIQSFWDKVKSFFHTEIIADIGGKPFTILTGIYLICAIFLLLYVATKLTHFLEKRVLVKRIPDQGTRASILTIFKYIVIFLGIIIVFQSAGFSLGTFSYLAGALGVGIGFGLQNIAQNFISGLLILFERPIKVGDRIEVGNVTGDVTEISLRSTKILTNDNINIIVPNSEFINNKVINWSYNERRVRFKFPVGVSYNEDPNKVRDIVIEVAKEHDGVLKHPAPQLWFSEYADSSLNFLLFIWTSRYIQNPAVLKSELYYKIFERFDEEGIEIPFPQRDLNFRGGFEPISKYFNKQTKFKNEEE